MSSHLSSLRDSFSLFQRKVSSLEEEVELKSSESCNKRKEIEVTDNIIQSLSNQQNICNRKSDSERQKLQRNSLNEEKDHSNQISDLKLQKEMIASMVETSQEEVAALKEEMRSIKAEKLKQGNKLQKLKSKNDASSMLQGNSKGDHQRFMADAKSRLLSLKQVTEELRDQVEKTLVVGEEYQQSLWSAVGELKKSIRKCKRNIPNVSKDEVIVISDDDMDVDDMNVFDDMGVCDDEMLRAADVPAPADVLYSLRRRIVSVDEEIVAKGSQLKDALIKMDVLMSGQQGVSEITQNQNDVDTSEPVTVKKEKEKRDENMIESNKTIEEAQTNETNEEDPSVESNKHQSEQETLAINTTITRPQQQETVSDGGAGLVADVRKQGMTNAGDCGDQDAAAGKKDIWNPLSSRSSLHFNFSVIWSSLPL